jgi:hypothetical protein
MVWSALAGNLALRAVWSNSKALGPRARDASANLVHRPLPNRGHSKAYKLARLKHALEELDSGVCTTNQPRLARKRLRAKIEDLEAQGVRPATYYAPVHGPRPMQRGDD